jgi:hypothetical protein
LPGLTEPVIEPDLVRQEPDKAEMARVRKVLTPGRRGGWLWRIFKVAGHARLIPVVPDACLPPVLRPSRVDADARRPRSPSRVTTAAGCRWKISRRCCNTPSSCPRTGSSVTIAASIWGELKLRGGGRLGGRGGARRLDDHHADGQEPLSLQRPIRSCAKSIEVSAGDLLSTSSHPSSAFWKPTSTSPNGGRTSTASRLRRNTISAFRRRSCRAGRPRF